MVISLFLLAWLGHACFLLVLLNMAYSRPWDKEFRKLFRLFIGAWIFLGPPVYLAFREASFERVWANFGVTIQDTLLAVYLVVCFATALIGLPFVTIQRAWRKPPAKLIAEKTASVDVAKELGFRPIGDGKGRALTKLSFNRIFHCDFTTLTIADPNLPAEWDGLTVLQISDLHFIGTPAKEYFDYVIQRCMADGVPDIVAVTGDIVDTKKHHRWIIPILGKLKWKEAAFAILGNHDWWQDDGRIRRRLAKLKMEVLGNSWTTATIRGLPMVVAGNECPWFTPAPDLSKCPPDVYKLLLSHTPDHINWAARRGVDLMLSGHNHGGQIRIPVFGSLFVPSWYSRRYDQGTFEKGKLLMHVTRGVACKEPLRIGCNAQVSRIVLKRA